MAGKQIVSAERENLIYLLLRKLEKQSCFQLVLVSETQMSEDFFSYILKKITIAEGCRAARGSVFKRLTDD